MIFSEPKEGDTRYADVETPIGIVRLVAKAGRLVRVILPGDEPPQSEPGLKIDHLELESPLEGAALYLERYFEGERVKWAGDLPPGCSPFQRLVWRATAEIPFGSTVSYGELARRVGKPGAARAVGGAMAANPLPILIPCHRVIASDGDPCGYGGGPELKRRLLSHEGVIIR